MLVTDVQVSSRLNQPGMNISFDSVADVKGALM
jgi:hypothetical protein